MKPDPRIEPVRHHLRQGEAAFARRPSPTRCSAGGRSHSLRGASATWCQRLLAPWLPSQSPGCRCRPNGAGRTSRRGAELRPWCQLKTEIERRVVRARSLSTATVGRPRPTARPSDGFPTSQQIASPACGLAGLPFCHRARPVTKTRIVGCSPTATAVGDRVLQPGPRANKARRSPSWPMRRLARWSSSCWAGPIGSSLLRRTTLAKCSVCGRLIGRRLGNVIDRRCTVTLSTSARPLAVWRAVPLRLLSAFNVPTARSRRWVALIVDECARPQAELTRSPMAWAMVPGPVLETPASGTRAPAADSAAAGLRAWPGLALCPRLAVKPWPG